ncbi:prephenate dehydrogenase [Chitinophaga terrae (ex Kim and Jung 2007)]|uniref:Prephenate dehydrogenase n=1 Tax=Chitinophaga terrae (ex Kim and Jung 2007) TaxID=408074 RepID=A0A1H4C3M5_9BACT|nr:prephenate dehydrogenase [Chitinophaga terrae (ex Kim and Jung 2007)]GEP92198.1 prephenate dehydrogenase [Chitinophaga terrae (ex Kim and Jung 2007)]SEA54958.1 prephenate dehydrogenase [Chitinophaga terrae (ex Kim and Jung 2007)]
MIAAIIGTGLIGGSLAITLKEKRVADKVLGVDQSAANLQRAVELNIVDEAVSLDDAMDRADLIVLAIPVDAVLKTLPGIMDKVKPHQVIMDVGSTKEKILELVAGHPNRGRFVAAHPMAGTEYSGPDAAVRNLFTHKTMVLCDVKNSDEDALELVENMVDSLQMRTVYMNGEEHDLHTAYVSHISHITSFALALTVLKKEKESGRIFELASGGFESTVRLAKSSPDMWVPIFKHNRNNVLDVLDEHISQLQQMKTLLEAEDYDTFYKLIQKSNKIRKILK